MTVDVFDLNLYMTKNPAYSSFTENTIYPFLSSSCLDSYTVTLSELPNKVR